MTEAIVKWSHADAWRIFRQKIKMSFAGEIFAEFRDLAKHPRYYVETWKDYVEVKKNCHFFHDCQMVSNQAKKALIVSFCGIAGVKHEAWLALGLRMHGWEIEVLVPRVQFWTRRYFQAMGIHTFHYPEDYTVDPSVAKQCAKDAEIFLEQNLSFHQVKNWCYQGVLIGSNILSTLQREQRLGSPDLKDPIMLQQLRKNLPSILMWVHSSQKIIQQMQPDIIYLIEPNYSNRPFVDYAIQKNIDVIQFVQPHRDDALLLKRLNSENSRTHPNSLAKETLQNMCLQKWTQQHELELENEFANRYNGNWVLQSRNQPNTEEKTKEEILNLLGFTSSRKIVVVFSHILWDANLFYGDDLFEDYADWFVQTVKAACNNPNLNWIIKLHPANLWKRAMEREKGELAEISVLRQHQLLPLPKHVKLLIPETNISTFSLFQSVDYGITVRGTTGLELPCFGVNTLTAGTGRYAGLGFTIDSHDKDEYLQRLATLHHCPPMTSAEIQLAKWHAYTLFRLRPWCFQSFRCVFGEFKNNNPFASNVLPAVSSQEEIKENGDLDNWVNWVTDPNRPVDYLTKVALNTMKSLP